MILDKIDNPAKIKKLSLGELRKLAEEVRKRIIEVTALNGGHVAPSLGATDIAIALLYVFDPIHDRIVWDVGHQSYAYKILTGRNDKFDTLRQFEGLSGFNNLSESKYDAFGVGHSSTSISASLGIAVAKETLGEGGKAVAIIGDGALTGGMAFEALNHAGHLQKDMIVILNDNNMSISSNVGALQKYFTEFLVSRSYNQLKGKVWDFLENMPVSKRNRRRLLRFIQKFEGNIINLIAPNVIFEDFGFKYAGPIDGDNIPRLIRIVRRAKDNMKGPVLLHVVTQKGKGYEPAEDNASKFHGLGPFHLETGECLSKGGTSYSKVFGEKLTRMAKDNKKIVAITPAMTDGTGLAGFAARYPKRFFDVGIAEQHAVTFAAGMATRGIKPFVAIYSTFLQRAYDQVIHDVALQKLPVVFCLDRAGLVGEDGATHHGSFDISYLKLIPDVVIMAPGNGAELEKMLDFAADYQKGPVFIRYPRGNALACDIDYPPLELGKSAITRKGKGIAIMGAGKRLEDAYELASLIKEKYSLEPMVIDLRFVKPLDNELLDKIEKDIKIMVTLGGIGESIKTHYCNSEVKIFSFGIPDRFVTHGKVEILKNILDLEPKQILNKLEAESIFQSGLL